MKILFLSNLLSYGGASKLIFDLLPRMKNKGNECEILILTDNHSKYVEDLRNLGVPVNVLPESFIGHWARIQYIQKWIREGEYDVVHANLFPTTYYCSIVKRLLGKKCPPLVMTEHSTDNKRRHLNFLRPLEKFIYKKYDSVISISDDTQENLCRWLGTEGDNKYIVIENGIDVEAFRSAEPLEKKDVCVNYEDGDILLLTVGSFTPQKNHVKLLEAIALLPENYKLLLCGEGPLASEIQAKIDELNLTQRVIFLGFRKDVARIMHTADILVIPSIREGFGLIAAEGMACGIAIAASEVPGLSEVVGDAGVKFDPVDNNEMSIRIKELSETVDVYAMKENAISKVEKYDINRMVTQYIEVYNRCIDRMI